MTDVLTRKEYIGRYQLNAFGRALHRKYYAQFVTDAVRDFVRRSIGEADILASTDPHFNDIPLGRWDRLDKGIMGLCLSRMGDINGHISKNDFGQRMIAWSLSDAVCIAKEAAQQIREQHTQSV